MIMIIAVSMIMYLLITAMNGVQVPVITSAADDDESSQVSQA